MKWFIFAIALCAEAQAQEFKLYCQAMLTVTSPGLATASVSRKFEITDKDLNQKFKFNESTPWTLEVDGRPASTFAATTLNGKGFDLEVVLSGRMDTRKHLTIEAKFFGNGRQRPPSKILNEPEDHKVVMEEEVVFGHDHNLHTEDKEIPRTEVSVLVACSTNMHQIY